MTTASNVATCIIKIISQNGKYEIIESANTTLFPIGTTANSVMTAKKDFGSTWLCDIRVTDKGSLKIDGISRHDKSATIIHSIPTPIVETESQPESESATTIIDTPIVIASAETIESESTKTIQPIVTVPKILDRDMSLWSESDYYISPDARKVFTFAYKLLQRDPYQSVKVIMTGDSGFGKTTIVERAAKFMDFDCIRINCATMRDVKDWFGYQEVDERNGASITNFFESEFGRAISRGNTVIILDEFNRVEPNLHNSLFPLLDDSGKTVVHDKEFIVAPNTIFVATVNVGYNYSGVFPVDNAMLNRFEFVLEVRPMPCDQEIAVLEIRESIDYESAEKIVKLATTIRDNALISCSTRDTLRVAKMVSVGMSVRDAFQYAIVNRIPDNEESAPLRKAVIDLVNGQLDVQVN